MCQPFYDGGLADTWFANQYRIVLCTSRKDLNGSAYLIIAPNYRVKLALAGEVSKVSRVFRQRLIILFCILLRDAGTAAHLLDDFE